MAIQSSLLRLLSFAMLALPVFAQEPKSVVPPSTVHPIHLNVVVDSHSGKPVAGLPQSAFTVLDNGHPQPIQSFRAVAGQGDAVKVMVVVDAVNIPYIQLAYERNEIDKFLKSNDGKLPQPTSLAIVTDTGTEATGFSSNGNELSQSLGDEQIGLRQLRRSSGFYGAEERLDLSLKAFQLVLTRMRSIPGRKAIVWVSPGWPILSGPEVQLTRNQENAIFQNVVLISRIIRETNTTVYAVDPLGAQQSPGRAFFYEEFLKPVRNPSQVLPGNLAVQVLAIQSGGLALSGSNDVRALIQRCFDETAQSYEITFTPPPPDAPEQFHKIDVKVAAPNVTVHALQGYYSGR